MSNKIFKGTSPVGEALVKDHPGFIYYWLDAQREPEFDALALGRVFNLLPLLDRGRDDDYIPTLSLSEMTEVAMSLRETNPDEAEAIWVLLIQVPDYTGKVFVSGLELWSGLGKPQKLQESKADSYVYLIGCKKNKTLKIGTSKNPSERLKTLQVGSAFRLELVHCFKGGNAEEMLLHKEFESLRTSGEWFRWHTSIIDRFKDLESSDAR